jgi:alginate O-acetyltransferase complex protein AlgI
MLFNSIEFFVFLPLVFALYWFVFAKSVRAQNLLIVGTSYLFYGWWDWRFLVLIAFTSLWAWSFGLADAYFPRGRTFRVVLSCVVNLGILGVFKYYHFFVDSCLVLLAKMGFTPHVASMQVILPVGISFYTFQALSYTIDVYRRTLAPTRDSVAFFAYVSFFPQLVAGPIERATNLLPQFLASRTFTYASAVDGCRQMLWGFFKKMVVADTCAGIANRIFDSEATVSSGALWVGVFCFALQIYCDFSGYSDIAIGCGRLFGIRLMRNFAYPYFARDIAEFWRRWHISLTTWFRDYIYVPLGGSRCAKLKQIRNTALVFLVSGFWHGANWTFIVWGLFHACCYLPLQILNRNRRYVDTVACGRMLPTLREGMQMVGTFGVVMIGWVFFRAPSLSVACDWLLRMVSCAGGLRVTGVKWDDGYKFLYAVALLVAVEWVNRNEQYGLARLPKSRTLRWLLYLVMVFVIYRLRGGQQAFIYFQF